MLKAREAGHQEMQVVIQDYFKNIIRLPCPDFTFNLNKERKKMKKFTLKEQITILESMATYDEDTEKAKGIYLAKLKSLKEKSNE